MLLRLISGLFKRAASETPPTPVAARGTLVADDGTRRPAVNLRGDSAALAASSEVSVEAHPELRSAALLHTHYLPDITPQALFDIHERYGRMFEDEVPDTERDLHRVDDANPQRRLRLGYLSPNFSAHSVSYLIEPVLAHHDRSAFEVYAYHTARARDAITDRVEASVDTLRQVHDLTDRELAHCIADDRIDVLVDLAGHTLGSRPGVFARRPAPVQITWLGYPDTTGVPAMDYRLTDAIADPPGAEARHTERLLRVAGAFLCYRAPSDAPAVSSRAASTHIVFCSFNTLEKVNDPLIALWSRVLRAVPGSRLLLKSGLLAQPAVAQRIRAAFDAQGVEEDRLELRGWLEDPQRHLAAYGGADIALDTSPYNGTITTCEAMWMGVPVVTLAGEFHMSRVGATLLTALGLEELIARTPDEFVDIATALAGDRERLAALRASMRPRLQASMLLDHAGFTRKIEALMRQAWTQWCDRR
jgi:protein O-GlcNAc transferase